MFDLVIRNGMIVDGTGAARYHADIAVQDGMIAAIGKNLGAAHKNFEADGRMVAPGWVDIHSHYDGQATWDPLLQPSGGHGVTTTVMGNCGVGFAPARAADRAALIDIMEGVEDIPGTALAEGLTWDWESFPDYLDALARKPRAIDVAAMVAHSAIRAYVMGPERSIREAAREDEIAAMQTLARAAAAAGGYGLSTSRTKLHLTAAGKPVPGSFADRAELAQLAKGIAAGGGGMLQLVIDWSKDRPGEEFDFFAALAEESGLPLVFLLPQYHDTPRHHELLLRRVAAARAGGLPIHAGVGTRAVGTLISLESRVHPFSHRPSFAAIAGLPRAEKCARLADPALRARILAEESVGLGKFWAPKMAAFEHLYPLGDPPQYEPPPEDSIAARAARQGISAQDYAYDLLLENQGTAWIYLPMVNYADGSFDPLLEMMRDPGAVVSLADGGAHCGIICDASAPTFLLTHWVAGRTRGERLALEEAVHLQTGRTAKFWHFADRGEIAVGKRADLNVIDLDRLRLHAPRWANDLPAGGRRLLQDADGYDATFLRGAMTWRNGQPTGAMPGALVRRAH